MEVFSVESRSNMKRLKIASNRDAVAAWKQAAQWMINKGHSIPSIQALSQKEPGVLDDDWGDLVHEAEATTFDFCGHPHRLVESYDDIHLEPILLNTALFDPNKETSLVYCEGFDELWVLDPYSRNNRSFTLEVTNDFVLFALMAEIGRPNPMVNYMASSLERTSNRLRSVLSSKTVRDADETLEEARHILAKTKRP